MASGTVKWFSPEKGFGFIIPNAAGPDVFVHVSALDKSGIGDLNEGDKVSYDIGDNKGRSCAVNIQII